MATLTDQLQIAYEEGKNQGLTIAQGTRQDPNITPETDLEGFQNQGGYAPEPETRTPGPITPRQKGKNVRQGDSAQRRNEAARGGERLRPEEIWPNYPNMLQINGNPSFDINPNKKTPTESEKRRTDKLQDRVDSEQQGADLARKKLRDIGIDPTALPRLIEAGGEKAGLVLSILGPLIWHLLPKPQFQMGQGEGDGTQIAIDPAALKALKAGTQGNKSSKEIRDLLRPYTKPDQFGHPSGSMRV